MQSFLADYMCYNFDPECLEGIAFHNQISQSNFTIEFHKRNCSALAQLSAYNNVTTSRYSSIENTLIGRQGMNV
jgi:hypothetical protein